MKFEIKNRFNGETVFSLETESFKLCVEAAIKAKADLRYANLRSADLSYANLRSADLSYADLSYANLSYADLRYADLRYANLSYADLRYADLRSADLSYADLSYANLRSADLSSADLSYADLSFADLRYAKGINKNICTPLRILLEQTGNIRAYKLVKSDGLAPFNGGLIYEIGKEYNIPNANTDESIHCAEGINLATLDWCMKEWQDGWRILIAEFTAKDIACIPIATDGKFRVFRCQIVGEKNLMDIGLIPATVEEVKS